MWKFGRSKKGSAAGPASESQAAQARALVEDTATWADGEGEPRQRGLPTPPSRRGDASGSQMPGQRTSSPGGGQRLVAQLAELQQTLQMQRSQIEDLHSTVQEQHRQIVQQANQIEALKTLLRDVNGANDPAPVANPVWWGEEGEQKVEQPPLTVADVAALSMGQILQQLHESQDACMFRDEEVYQLEATMEKQGSVIQRLEKERERSSRLVLGLKKELHHYKLVVREKSKTNATMESKLELARLEKVSMSRMVSGMDEGSDAESIFMTPPHFANSLLDTSPERAAPDAGSAARLRGEVQTLQAELAAARALADSETARRTALEQEVERLRRSVQQGAGNGAETESEASEGVGEELALLVLREQLSSFRELNGGFQSMWESCASDFKVRGKTYMADGIKVEGGDPLFELVHMEIFNVDAMQRADHITAMFKDADADSVYMRCSQASRPPFLLIVNFQVPGSPPCSVVAYMALAPHLRARLEREVEEVRSRKVREAEALANGGGSELGGSEAGGEGQAGAGNGDGDAIVMRLLAEFLEGDAEYCDSRLKLIPSVVEGPATVRWGVGNKPVILGKKITQRYFRGPGYLEVGVDIGSSIIASRVLGSIREYSRNIVIETALVLQGEQESELPERILAGMRFSHVDWKLAEKLSERLRMPLISPRPAS